ncbi:MAG: hypothetical protein V1859_10210 [archaeon]
MFMELFANRFPEIAEKETRCIMLPIGGKLPAGSYYFPVSFCNEKNCDCRRAFINVIYEEEPIATIGFGWEDIKFYEKWAEDKSMAKDLKGPVLEFTGIRTKYSEKALSLFKEVLMNDKIFLERLPKHYKIFKESLSENEEVDIENLLDDFKPNEHTVLSLCKEKGTGFDAINDDNREAFLPIIMAVEESIWSYYKKNSKLKDIEVIELLKNLRDNIFSENAKFNSLEKEIITKIKILLKLNNFDRRDISLSISSILKSSKLHRSISGSRGYLDFISGFFNEMVK